MLVHRFQDVFIDVYCCFIVVQKAFDHVKHSIIIEAPRGIVLDIRGVGKITTWYRNQTASVLVDGMELRLLQQNF